jgi:hypothetical protein
MKNLLLTCTSILFSLVLSEVILRTFDINITGTQVKESSKNIEVFPTEILNMFSNVPSPNYKLFNNLQQKVINNYCCQTYKITEFLSSNVTGHVKKFDPGNDNILYDAKYSIDINARRITPITNTPLRTKGLLFLGGSFTFGEGVQDDETFSYYFSKLARRIIPYNISVQGYSLSDLYYHLNLEEKGLFKNIPKDQENIAIYYFIGEHIKRSTYPITAFIEQEKLNHFPKKRLQLKNWHKKKPYYLVSDNELTLKGTLKDRVFKNNIYSQLAKLKLLSMTGIADFLETSFDLQDFKVLINHMHIKLKRIMNVSKLFIIIHPKDSKLFKNLNEDIHKDIRVIKIDQSYASIKKLLNNNHEIIYDGHPTKYFNEFFANMIYLKIKDEIN